MNIGNKLILIILIIVIVPILFMNELFFSKTRKEIKKEQFYKLEIVADLKVDMIEKYFNDRRGDMATAQHYWNIKTNLPILNKTLDDPGSPSKLAAEKTLDSQLQTFQKTYDYYDVLLINTAGIVVYCSNPDHKIEETGSSLPHFNNKLMKQARNGIVFSDIFQDKREGHGFEMFLAGPVYGYDNTHLGFIVFELNMLSLYKFIQDTSGLGETGETLIGKDLGDQVLFLNPLRHDPKAALSRRVDYGSKNALPIQKATQGEDGSGLSVDYRGDEIIAAWRHISSMNWGLVAKIDSKEAFAAISKFRKVNAAILFLTLCFVIIITLVVARSISKPINELGKGAKRLGEGELNFRFNIMAGGEVGQLAASFNLMAEELSAAYTNLEMKVEDRTKALKKSRSAALSVLQDANTLRQQAEETSKNLYETNQELRSLTQAIEQSPTAVIITDIEGTIQYVNPKFTEVSGYNSEETIGRNPRLLNAGKLLPEVYKELWKTITSGNIWHGDLCNKKKNGEIFWESVSIAPVRDPEGEVTHYVAVKEDITKRREAQKEMVSMARFADLNPAPVFRIDGNGFFLLTNVATRELFDTENLVGQILSDVCPELDQEIKIGRAHV